MASDESTKTKLKNVIDILMDIAPDHPDLRDYRNRYRNLLVSQYNVSGDEEYLRRCIGQIEENVPSGRIDLADPDVFQCLLGLKIVPKTPYTPHTLITLKSLSDMFPLRQPFTKIQEHLREIIDNTTPSQTHPSLNERLGSESSGANDGYSEEEKPRARSVQ